MLKKYAIEISTELMTDGTDEDKYFINLMKEQVENKSSFFKEINLENNEKLYIFEVEIISEETTEKEIINLAMNFSRIYKWPYINVWKKNVDSENPYYVGIGFTLNHSENSVEATHTELLLGGWDNWCFYKNDEELQWKQKEIEKSENGLHSHNLVVSVAFCSSEHSKDADVSFRHIDSFVCQVFSNNREDAVIRLNEVLSEIKELIAERISGNIRFVVYSDVFREKAEIQIEELDLEFIMSRSDLLVGNKD
ncbi:hypothetical protein V7024_06240 [Bacillus sp. JJ864]|uniref:hypothetical protein n=1 Tax=Bacillus sp. JJ864 TaxID=3122975 RepID=UPI00300012B3